MRSVYQHTPNHDMPGSILTSQLSFLGFRGRQADSGWRLGVGWEADGGVYEWADRGSSAALLPPGKLFSILRVFL